MVIQFVVILFYQDLNQFKLAYIVEKILHIIHFSLHTPIRRCDTHQLGGHVHHLRLHHRRPFSGIIYPFWPFWSVFANQVSMCINVIQLTLEELFEELLLTMIEEYGEAGQPVEKITATMKPKMSLMDLWKVWKRRRHRMSMMEQQNGGWSERLIRYHRADRGDQNPQGDRIHRWDLD